MLPSDGLPCLAPAAVLALCPSTYQKLSGTGCSLKIPHWPAAEPGDLLTRCFPDSGRIMAAQFSVLTTFPCTLVIFRLLPTSVAVMGDMHTLMLPYGAAFFVTGLLISWCGRRLLTCWSCVPDSACLFFGGRYTLLC